MIQDYIAAYPQGIELSTAQKYWLNTEKDAAQQQAFHSLLLPLAQKPDLANLQQAVNTLVARHVSLNCQFSEVVGFRGIRQVIKAASQIEIEQHDLTEHHDVSVTSLAGLIPVDLQPQNGKTLQLAVVEMSDQMYVLLRVSAIALDLASAQSLLRQLLTTVTDDEVVQYPDFQAWISELNHSEDAQQGIAYWQQFINTEQGKPYQLELPYRKAPEKIAHQLPSYFSADLAHGVEQVMQLAERLDIELTTVYQAAWWLLVARISQSQGFVGQYKYDPRLFGEELHGALGLFQQYLPVAVDKAQGVSLRDWLSQFDFQLNQHIEWAECFKPEQQAIAASISFEISFDQPIGAQLGADNQLELQMCCYINDEAASLFVQYNKEVYSVEAIEQLSAQYQHLLVGLVQWLDVDVAKIALATEQETAVHLALNQSELTEAPDLVLAKLQKYAKQNPSALALRQEEVQLSYLQLADLVDLVAGRLMQQGVESQDIVVLALPRSWQLVVMLLATLRAGASYCPLDPEWPQKRQEQLLCQLNAKLIVGEVDAKNVISLDKLLSKDLLNCHLQQASISGSLVSLPQISANDAAYILFTSGSTGQPKGVVVEHQQLAYYCAASTEALALASAKNMALTSTVAADIGNTCLFNAFYNGACLTVANNEQMLDGQAFAQFVLDYDIDCIKIVPSHLQALLESEPSTLPSKLILGGEASVPTLLQKIHRIAPQSQVFNHYGPTEATVGVLAHQYTDLTSFSGTVAKLSQVFAGSEIFIVNGEGQLCATGEQGELYIAGKQLARGYFNRASSDGFVSDLPFAQRLYPTGDLARYMPDNTISLSGRKDDQIQIRGFRVEPNDVAGAMSRYLETKQCYVAVQKSAGQDCLVAFLTGYQHQGQTPIGLLEGEFNFHLQTALREYLPDAMVPSFFVALDKLPLLANGKVDRKALPDISSLREQVYVAPKSQLETLLADILADILELKQVSIDASFFDLGGHSLSAIKLVTRIKKLLLLDIEPGFVFENPTINALAQALVKRSDNPTKLEKLALTQLKLAQLTPEQQQALKQKLGMV